VCDAPIDPLWVDEEERHYDVHLRKPDPDRPSDLVQLTMLRTLGEHALVRPPRSSPCESPLARRYAAAGGVAAEVGTVFAAEKTLHRRRDRSFEPIAKRCVRREVVREECFAQTVPWFGARGNDVDETEDEKHSEGAPVFVTR
jgi:hypothetical protein